MIKTIKPTENSKANGQYKNATKTFDNKTIADRLWTVTLSNNFPIHRNISVIKRARHDRNIVCNTNKLLSRRVQVVTSSVSVNELYYVATVRNNETHSPAVTFLRRKMTRGRFSTGVIIRRYTGHTKYFSWKINNLHFECHILFVNQKQV